MKTLRERLNEQDGLTSKPDHYSLPDMCMFCRHSRDAESMATGSPEPHPTEALIRKCFLFGCWVEDNGHCRKYRMFSDHEA